MTTAGEEVVINNTFMIFVSNLNLPVSSDLTCNVPYKGTGEKTGKAKQRSHLVSSMLSAQLSLAYS